MKNKFNELEKLYGQKDVKDCVNIANKLYKNILGIGETLFNLLWYLERSKKYKQYDGYDKIGFNVFIYEVCNIPYNRYRQIAYAYNWFPKESKEFGPNVIQEIRDKVGSTKIPVVLKEIKKKTKNVSDPEKLRAIQHETIKLHTIKKPSKAQVDTKIYWKNKYEDLWKKYKLLEKENDEFRKQLAKQRAPMEQFFKLKETFNEMTV